MRKTANSPCEQAGVRSGSSELPDQHGVTVAGRTAGELHECVVQATALLRRDAPGRSVRAETLPHSAHEPLLMSRAEWT
ncbi:hypothetical protein SGLAM104S_08317 [Streptomyces glaucescens]